MFPFYSKDSDFRKKAQIRLSSDAEFAHSKKRNRKWLLGFGTRKAGSTVSMIFAILAANKHFCARNGFLSILWTSVDRIYEVEFGYLFHFEGCLQSLKTWYNFPGQRWSF